MRHLIVLLYALVATVLAGSLVVIALALGNDTVMGIVTAAGAGALLALPVTLTLAKRMR